PPAPWLPPTPPPMSPAPPAPPLMLPPVPRSVPAPPVPEATPPVPPDREPPLPVWPAAPPPPTPAVPAEPGTTTPAQAPSRTRESVAGRAQREHRSSRLALVIWIASVAGCMLEDGFTASLRRLNCQRTAVPSSKSKHWTLARVAAYLWRADGLRHRTPDGAPLSRGG